MQMPVYRQFAADNLTECCEELLESQKTGILVDGKIRELASMIRQGAKDINSDIKTFPALDVALSLVRDAALEFVVAHKK